MSETRYAILIGNNNYNDPKLSRLDYAVKDVEDFKSMLVENCRFLPGNIYSVTNSLISVKRQIEDALIKTKRNFRTKEDLFVFYFSGHGQYVKSEAKSKIIFEDKGELDMGEIVNTYFTDLNPKNSYLLIDACQSGTPPKAKGNTTEKLIRVLENSASGMYMMFATENKREAFEDKKYENSYFTHFFIKAVKTENLYDEHGFLTMQAIDNYIKKYVGQVSDQVQVPVSQLHGKGYKPFAFLKSKMKSEIKKAAADKSASDPVKADVSKPVISEGTLEQPSPAAISFEESLSRESRLAVQQVIQNIIDEAFDKLELGFTDRNFSSGVDFDGIPSTDEINERIIYAARKEKAEGMDGMFEVKQKPKNPFQPNLSFNYMITAFLQQQEPELSYRIYSSTEFFYARHIYVKEKSIYEVRGGLIVMVYQTNFGFAVGSTLFNYNWTGLSDSQLIVTGTIIKPYTINDYNKDKLTQHIQETIARFPKELDSWSEKRKKEIEAYQKNADKN